MAGRGFAPSGERSRQRDKAATLTLVSDGKMRGFPLPRGAIKDKNGKSIPWNKETLKWWNAWRKSPQATRMLTEPDWYFLLDTALLHHQMWENGRWELFAEVRYRVSKFGATPEDRARLKIEVSVAAPEAHSAAGNVTSYWSVLAFLKASMAR